MRPQEQPPGLRLALALLAALAMLSAAAPPAGSATKSQVITSPVTPLAVVRAFDLPAQPWLPGHRGVDLATEDGAAVHAPADAVVRFAGTVVDRPVLTLDLGGGVLSTVEPVVADVEAGERVVGGSKVGHESTQHRHCPGHDCVHWGVRVDGDYRDPLRLLGDRDASILLPGDREPAPLPDSAGDGPAGSSGSSGGGAGPWGGHRNGQIPAAALCPLSSAGHLLRCDAARGFEALNEAYRATFGNPVSVTDSYRDYDSQVRLKRTKGRMAATPGRSNHGWGLALDLGGGINSFGTRQHDWMRANAPRFGWVHPAWARSTGTLPEPWHWEWNGGP